MTDDVESSALDRELAAPTPGLTSEQAESLNWLIHDPDWDCSQRADAHELLIAMRDKLRAAPSPATLRAERDAALAQADRLQALLAESMTREGAYVKERDAAVRALEARK